jgi:hypothetical protein
MYLYQWNGHWFHQCLQWEGVIPSLPTGDQVSISENGAFVDMFL